MIGVIDYGVGNVQAFLTVFKRLGVTAERLTRPRDMDRAERLILPGVGAFDVAMRQLNASGLRDALENAVHGRAVPILGVCVGMQMLGDRSEEGAELGLGWIPGRVRAFDSRVASTKFPTPHMGWNDAEIIDRDSFLFRDLGASARFYFLHSYFFDPADSAHVKAVSSYGVDFACVVGREHIFGAQFHPEKSHHYGAQLLKNFGCAR